MTRDNKGHILMNGKVNVRRETRTIYFFHEHINILKCEVSSPIITVTLGDFKTLLAKIFTT